MRKIILLVLGLLALAYIVFSLAELQSILATLQRSNPLYLVAAIAVEAVVLVASTATFLALYRLVGLGETRFRMFLMVTAGTFVNVVVPSGGMGGMAVFMDAARRRGQPTGRVMLTGVLYLVCEYTSLLAALTAGFLVLVQRGRLDATELGAAGVLLLMAACIGGGLVVGYRSSRQLGILLAWLYRGVNRLLRPVLHRDALNVLAADAFAAEMGEGFETLRANRNQIVLPLALAVMNKLLLMLVLALSFLALGVPFDPGTVVAGFSIGHLFFYVSPTPSGVGFVDSILPVALNSLSVAFSQAVLVVLVYRLVTFWLPLGFGAVAFRHLQRMLGSDASTGQARELAKLRESSFVNVAEVEEVE
jgi:uncharacterized protein (TIRG00374 family)